jgi:hypothetical protein
MARRWTVSGAGIVGIVAMLCAILRCSGEKNPAGPKPVVDRTPPAAVTDLAAQNPTDQSVTLTWTAPGDDGTSGSASRCDVRFCTEYIGTATWAYAAKAAADPIPKAAGTADTFVVFGLSPGTSYYFALKTADEVPNWSALSNVVHRTTAARTDTAPPAAVSDLAVGYRGARTVLLTWTAPGNDGDTGIAASYDIRYAEIPITEAGWTTASQAEGEPKPRPAGTPDEFAVTGLAPNTEYYFALKTADERPNVSALSNVALARTLPCLYCWLPLGSGIEGNGEESPYVSSLAIYDGRLIAAGSFGSAGGAAAHNIAAWDGGSWTPLGPGIDGPVNALAVYDGRLMAARTPNSSTPASIYAWDGSSWTPLAGMNFNEVFALASYDGKLIAGGLFDTAGGKTTNAIAAWDGSQWYELGSGLGGGGQPAGRVYSLASYNGQLIAAGTFASAGGFQAANIASWDGLSWKPLQYVDGGADPAVRALAVCNSRLIAGGAFTAAGGTSADDIAAWDGSSWTPLGTGLGGGSRPGASALAVFGDRLIAGGGFMTAGGLAANYSAAWDGSFWSSMGPGMSGGSGRGVLTFIIYNEQLIAGGDFSAAGGISVNCIALWAN